MEKVIIFYDILNDRYLQWIDVYIPELGWTDTLGQCSVFQPKQETEIINKVLGHEEAWIEVRSIYGININGVN